MKQNLGVVHIGEEISIEEGVNMTREYLRLHPENAVSFTVGKDMLLAILDQRDCAGIRIYNAIEEAGMQALVMAGVDASEKLIRPLKVVSEGGAMREVMPVIAKNAETGSVSFEEEIQWQRTD